MLWILIALIVFIFQIITILVLEFRHPSKTVAWLLILFIFPMIGFVMYYFLAREYKQRRMVRHIETKDAEITRQYIEMLTRQCAADHKDQPQRLYAMLQNIPDSPITECSKSKILTNAEMAFPAILDSMAGAKAYIHIEFYTVRDDRIGRQFQQLMIKKALEGVKVRLIYDGVGSYDLPSSYLEQLKSAGVECYCFLPPFIAFFDKRMNYRNHRKVVVVDGQVGYVGGMNIGDEYLGGDERLGFWRDTQIELQGDAVYYLQYTFLADWAFVSGQKLDDLELYYPKHKEAGLERVQMIASGPDMNWDGILELFFAAITAAAERIYITTPYFIPDQSISMALKAAAISGLDIRVIIPGVPDSSIVNYASLSYVEELMQAGVKFYQYQKGFVHSKILIIDQALGSVGTANMDMRSFFSNFELNAVLFDKGPIERLVQDFMQDLQDSQPLVLAEFAKRSRMQKGKEILARLLSPLL